MLSETWYPLFSAVAYFGSLALAIVARVRWVIRRFRSYRVLDWAYELLVTWLVAVALWHGIRRGPIWDTDLAGSPVWLRGLIAIAIPIGSILGAWSLERKATRPEQPENGVRSSEA
jgi:thiol:disulfide interchange protein